MQCKNCKCKICKNAISDTPWVTLPRVSDRMSHGMPLESWELLTTVLIDIQLPAGVVIKELSMNCQLTYINDAHLSVDWSAYLLVVLHVQFLQSGIKHILDEPGCVLQIMRIQHQFTQLRLVCRVTDIIKICMASKMSWSDVLQCSAIEDEVIFVL